MLSALLSLALAASPAAEPENAAPDAPAKAVASAKKDKTSPDYIRCKRMRITGSNIKRKVCQTNEAWDRMAQQGKNAALEIHENANTGYTKSD